jgi:uncharacterized membrane protein
LTLAPLLASPAATIFHASAATAALISGAAVIFVCKGTLLHMTLGRVWAGIMLVTAITSLRITGIIRGRFGYNHILSLATLVNIPYAIWMRRVGNIRAHSRAMAANYAGLRIAGAFALVPGFKMRAVLFA